MTEEKMQAPSDGLPDPYELVFGSEVFEGDRFPMIREEAEARKVDARASDRFIMLGTVGALLQEILPEGTSAEEFTRYGTLLYQAYNYWLSGKPYYELEEEETRALIEGEVREEDEGRGELIPPQPSGYLRLPRHLFWARIEEGATPEPVDGFFWSLAGPGPDGEKPRLELLLILGLFPGRPGFSTISIDSDFEVRRDSPPGAEIGREPFENILPGGELQGWHGLVTESEVLELVSRIFGSLSPSDDQEEGEDDDAE